jgi:hypothetical protein
MRHPDYDIGYLITALNASSAAVSAPEIAPVGLYLRHISRVTQSAGVVGG